VGVSAGRPFSKAFCNRHCFFAALYGKHCSATFGLLEQLDSICARDAVDGCLVELQIMYRLPVLHCKHLFFFVLLQQKLL
jgi:hypothetical protein